MLLEDDELATRELPEDIVGDKEEIDATELDGVEPGGFVDDDADAKIVGVFEVLCLDVPDVELPVVGEVETAGRLEMAPDVSAMGETVTLASIDDETGVLLSTELMVAWLALLLDDMTDGRALVKRGIGELELPEPKVMAPLVMPGLGNTKLSPPPLFAPVRGQLLVVTVLVTVEACG